MTIRTQTHETTTLKANSLSTTDIVFMVVAAAAPLTVIGGDFPIGIALGNGVGFPSMYAISAVVLAVFSVGVMAISRFVYGESFASYIGASFGRRLGMGASYLSLLTYSAVQFAIYGFLGELISNTLQPVINSPWWLWTLIFVGFVGFLGYRDIELSSKALGICLVAEIAIVVLLDVVITATGGDSGLNLNTFTIAEISSGSPGIGIMMAITGFVGFESTMVFRSEAKNPDVTVPRATYIALAIIGIFYALSGWAIIQGVGTDKAVETASTDPEAMVAETAVRYLGSWSGPVVHVLLITSLFAAVLSFHNVLTRLQHDISHRRGLPRVLRRVHFKHNSPHLSSLFQTGTAFVVLGLCALLALDPVTQVYTFGSGITTMTFVVLMAITCAAIIVYFRRFPTAEVSVFSKLLAPVLAIIGIVAAIVVMLINIDELSEGNTFIALSIVLSGPLALVSGAISATFIPELDEKLRR